jgi:hypothetical protein
LLITYQIDVDGHNGIIKKVQSYVLYVNIRDKP